VSLYLSALLLLWYERASLQSAADDVPRHALTPVAGACARPREPPGIRCGSNSGCTMPQSRSSAFLSPRGGRANPRTSSEREPACAPERSQPLPERRRDTENAGRASATCQSSRQSRAVRDLRTCGMTTRLRVRARSRVVTEIRVLRHGHESCTATFDQMACAQKNRGWRKRRQR